MQAVMLDDLKRIVHFIEISYILYVSEQEIHISSMKVTQSVCLLCLFFFEVEVSHNKNNSHS